VFSTSAQWSHETISSITVKGNKTVTTEAILKLMTLHVGSFITQAAVANDIKNIFASTYFQDVRFDSGEKPGDFVLFVVEKPTVNEILFEGFEVVSSSSLKEKIITKSHTIIDEKKLVKDLRAIEQSYVEKGYYLAKASYQLEVSQPGIVNVIFRVKENTPLIIRNVNLIGNEYFSDQELHSFLMTKPYSWLSVLTSAGLYRDEFLSADQQNLMYYYRDNGYAEATVYAPLSRMDYNKKDISVSFFIEEGEPFFIGKINIEGDLIESESLLKQKLSLTEGKRYRISKFNNDMKALKLIYGNNGYAFAYIYPTFQIDREKRLYHIQYKIIKGEKSYFRRIVLEGNVKTRDNILRRLLKFSEGQRFHATNLEKSKSDIERLGFFDSVQVIREDDKENHAVDVKIVIKEKSTGKILASLGASPDISGSGVSFFGQLQYQEPNLLGNAYSLIVNTQVSPNPEGNKTPNYSLGVSFSNLSIYDSPWSFGIGANYSYNVQSTAVNSIVNKIYIANTARSTHISVGRELVENLRLSFMYSLSENNTDPSVPLTLKFYASGKTEKISQTLTYDGTDSYIAPTSGIVLNATNTFAIRGFFGQYPFGAISAFVSYYYPVYYTESFKTNFRFAFQTKYVYQLSPSEGVPYWERLQLGNAYFMKGYTYPGEALSVTQPVMISPATGQTVALPIGGNRSFYSTLEYFIPIIPEAGLRFVTFSEAGLVLDDYDHFKFKDIKYDVGFGFRWNTPVAPFRFEWAFPVENSMQLGQAHFIFTIGGDNFNNGN
jgi:outer membrane protein insertion porin family